LKPEEIETVLKHFKVCPRCKSIEGFWLGSKLEYIYFQCKDAGQNSSFKKSITSVRETKKPERLLFFKK